MISLSKTVMAASLATLLATAATGVQADSVGHHAIPSSPEIGHVQWNWWDKQPVMTTDISSCNQPPPRLAASAEVGPQPWDWWLDIDADQKMSSSSHFAVREGNYSEVGHVAWNWWQSGQSLMSDMPLQVC